MDILMIALTVPAAFFAMVLHGSVKALCSARLNDPTPKRNGFLKGNPFKYVEPIGLVLMVIFGYGWTQVVPTTATYYRERKKGVLMVYVTPSVVCLLSGVAAAALVCMLGVSFFPYDTSVMIELVISPVRANWSAFGAADYLLLILSLFAKSCVCLAIFNVLPVHPMDCSKILLTFLPPDAAVKLTQYEKIIQIVLLLLLAMGFIGMFLNPLAHAILRAVIWT
ncbi:MAG: site-2 protease family protein [Defluviitaleaceae bacterium]|nr:site-2 protease family protein [Defluviitaleaceae bacterium]